MPTPFSAIASRSSERGTSSEITACQTGKVIAVPTPAQKVSASSSGAVISPAAVRPEKHKPTVPSHSCTAIIILRRSTMSPIAPAGSDRKNTGSIAAACTSAT